MGYKYQFVTLAGFHQLNHGMFELARGYRERGMAAYADLQEAEFAAEAYGYSAIRHQREVGTGYFDAVALALSGGASSTTAMARLDRDRPVLRRFASRRGRRRAITAQIAGEPGRLGQPGRPFAVRAPHYDGKCCHGARSEAISLCPKEGRPCRPHRRPIPPRRRSTMSW